MLYSDHTPAAITYHDDDDNVEVDEDDEGAALATALRRIEFLEQQFDITREAIKIIRKHESLTESYIAPQRPENNGRDLVNVLSRLDELEFEFGWIKNTVIEFQEYMGIEKDFYARLPYRWEGPPPDTFRLKGRTYYDVRPMVLTPSGPAPLTTLTLDKTAQDGDWEIVVNDSGSILDKGKRVEGPIRWKTMPTVGPSNASNSYMGGPSRDRPAAIELAANPPITPAVTAAAVISSPTIASALPPSIINAFEDLNDVDMSHEQTPSGLTAGGTAAVIPPPSISLAAAPPIINPFYSLENLDDVDMSHDQAPPGTSSRGAAAVTPPPSISRDALSPNINPFGDLIDVDMRHEQDPPTAAVITTPSIALAVAPPIIHHENEMNDFSMSHEQQPQMPIIATTTPSATTSAVSPPPFTPAAISPTITGVDNESHEPEPVVMKMVLDVNMFTDDVQNIDGRNEMLVFLEDRNIDVPSGGGLRPIQEENSHIEDPSSNDDPPAASTAMQYTITSKSPSVENHMRYKLMKR